MEFTDNLVGDCNEKKEDGGDSGDVIQTNIGTSEKSNYTQMKP